MGELDPQTSHQAWNHLRVEIFEFFTLTRNHNIPILASHVRRIVPKALSLFFGGMYVNVGVQHFTNTAWFEPIVPAVLGDPTIWVLITGVMEIAIGVGLILPWTRRHAALGSMVFLVGIYWANLNMWVNNIPLDGKTYAHHWHVLRLIAQLGMMGLSYAIWRSSQSTENL